MQNVNSKKGTQQKTVENNFRNEGVIELHSIISIQQGVPETEETSTIMQIQVTPNNIKHKYLINKHLFSSYSLYFPLTRLIKFSSSLIVPLVLYGDSFYIGPQIGPQRKVLDL